MFKPFLCISFILILPFFATSQKVKFELFTAADGFSSNESHHLVQDDQGFLWFLNASRIYRYDGNNFNVHPLPPGYLPGADELLTAMTSYKDSLLFILAETHAFLQKVKGVVDENLGNVDFNPGMLSHALGLSPSQLYRKMNALTGTTPALFVRSVRLHKAKELLQTTDLNVSEIAYEVGFSSPSYFSLSPASLLPTRKFNIL